MRARAAATQAVEATMAGPEAIAAATEATAAATEAGAVRTCRHNRTTNGWLGCLRAA